jgi:DNA-binding transcriptional MerR regulator
MSDEPGTYGVEELAERAGVSRRTVRYYVQRGLLPAPLGLGRGNHYTEAHLAALVRVRELQEQGVPLEEIAGRTRAAEMPGAAPRADLASQPGPTTQTMWTRVELGGDVELHLRGRRLTDEQVRKLEVALKKVLGEFST